jgi:hypothetical protein
MRATLIFEASRSDGAKYRFELNLGLLVLGWLGRWF